MQEEIHERKTASASHNFISMECIVFQELFLSFIQGIVFFVGQEIIDTQEKSTGTTGWICNSFLWLRSDTFDHHFNQCTGCEILSRTTLGVFCILLQQTFVDVAFIFYTHEHPLLCIDECDELI